MKPRRRQAEDFGDRRDQAFLLRNAMIYLRRHLEIYPILDREFFETVFWLFKGEAEALLTSLLGPESCGLEEEIREAEGDPGVCSLVLMEALGASRRRHRRVRGRLGDLLEERLGGLRYQGKSEIEKSLAVVQEMFHLDASEAQFCVFLYLVSYHIQLERFFVDHVECQRIHRRKYLAALLGMSARELQSVIAGTLKRIGLLEMNRFNLAIEEEFQTLLENPSANVLSMHFKALGKCADIPLDAHFIPEAEVRYVCDLLKKKPEGSVHILLYGPPGTGKSTFAVGVAQQLGIPAYAINRTEDNKARSRRMAIVACLNMTNNGPGSLIVVDEADNLLNTQHSWFKNGETFDKAWLNQTLEEPGVRMIWITNRLDDIEESVLRRFTFSLRFKAFNRCQRTLLWRTIVQKNAVAGLFDPADLEALAKRYSLGAGAIDLALKGALEAKRRGRKRIQEAIHLSLRAHETLLNGGEDPPTPSGAHRSYALDGLSIEGDPYALLDQLKRFDRLLRKSPGAAVRRVQRTVLLHGPPGSGKTEFGRHATETLGRELITVRPSDILGKYVGESERNLRQAFESAEMDEAVLLMDEAESFLFNRDRAERSWEISLTNEFLTRMESFHGILICTTNRLEDLDRAALRRFQFKLGFGFLGPEGKQIFYERLLSELVMGFLADADLAALQGIPDLTPGDFKAVLEQFRYYGKRLKHRTLVNALAEESRIKRIHGGKSKVVGF